MKRTLLSLTLVLLSALGAWAQTTAKYVFYFIGDGMGVNQVNCTETYLGALEGQIGIKPLLFASFPNVALVNTQSYTNGITDSAAGGTALSTGRKTYNQCVGLMPDSITPINSIAVWAKNAGAAVGIATSVSVDHATPGAPDTYQLCRNAGFTIAHGYKDFQKLQRKADRMILLQSEAANRRDNASLPYAIDRKKGDLTLAEITRAAITFLQKKNPDRFFCMIEGGKIDWASHTNDPAAMVREVIDTDEAIRVAYEFYQQHPDETLILITADHETGGLGLGTGDYTLHTRNLSLQRMSSYEYSTHLKQLRKEKGAGFTWELVRRDLEENFGFWKHIKITQKEEKALRDAYQAMVDGTDKAAESLYASECLLAARAKECMSAHAHIGWTTGGHTNGYVPVFAVGAGAEAFRGRIDNTEIPKTIAKIAQYEMQ